MAGRKNRRRSDSETFHEYRMHEQIQRGETVFGGEAGWLDRSGPVAATARRHEAPTRHAGRRARAGLRGRTRRRTTRARMRRA